MRISDWSSDVCSSDLLLLAEREVARDQVAFLIEPDKVEQGLGLVLLLGRVAPEQVGKGRVTVRHRDQHVAHAVHLGIDARLLEGAQQAEAGDLRHSERRTEEQTSELQSLMRLSYAVLCLNTKKQLRQQK